MDDDSTLGLRPGEAMAKADLVAGLGARRHATVAEILALIDTSLAAIGADAARLGLLVTREAIADHAALSAVATRLGIPLLGLPDAELGAPAPNPSARVARHLGLPSVAEAAALAFGPLLLEKRRSANATCALSQRLYALPRIRASAPSTVSASAAGA